MVTWIKKTSKEAVAAGRRPETVADSHLLTGSILEIQPTGKTTGKIVWEWHAWDHVTQDFDEKKPNFGEVGKHPELIDLNFGDGVIAAMVAKPEELEKLRGIGYIGNAGRKPQRPQADWLHINAVTYNAELDQIMLSVYEFSEIWIIDHSTKPAKQPATKVAGTAREAIFFIAGAILALIARAPSKIKSYLVSTTLNGSPRGFPAKGTCSSSITECVVRGR